MEWDGLQPQFSWHPSWLLPKFSSMLRKLFSACISDSRMIWHRAGQRHSRRRCPKRRLTHTICASLYSGGDWDNSPLLTQPPLSSATVSVDSITWQWIHTFLYFSAVRMVVVDRNIIYAKKLYSKIDVLMPYHCYTIARPWNASGNMWQHSTMFTVSNIMYYLRGVTGFGRHPSISVQMQA